MRKLMLLTAVLIAVPALAIPTQAVKFKELLPTGTTSAKEPGLAGTVTSDQLVPFSTPAGVVNPASGTLQVRTVKGADGALTFYWKINMAAGSVNSVKAIQIAGFPQVVYDANWRLDGLGTIAPQSVSGSVLPSGWTMAFEFLNPLQKNESSRLFFLKTKATASKPATATLILSNNISILKVPVLAPAS